MAGGVIGKVTAGGGTHLVTNTFYGTCDTAAATAAKIVKLVDTAPNAATLITGMLLCVKFTYANGVASPTLTIQTSGGTQIIAAKSIMRYGTTAPSTNAATSWTAGAVVPFIYDGTNWIEASSWDNNSTYSALSLGFGYGTCGTAAATAAKAVTLSSGVLGANGSIVAVKFTNANTVANPTLNVNSKGAKNIFWHGAALTDTGLIKAGDIVTFMYDGTQYQIISISPVTVSTTSITPVTKKTVVTSVTKKTVVTGGSTTAVPNISKKTVVTEASVPANIGTSVSKTAIATSAVSSEVLDLSAVLTNVTLSTTAASVTTGDSVTVGTAINAYTSLTTGDSVDVSTGDSVTTGTAVTVVTGIKS